VVLSVRDSAVFVVSKRDKDVSILTKTKTKTGIRLTSQQKSTKIKNASSEVRAFPGLDALKINQELYFGSSLPQGLIMILWQ